MRTLVSLRCAFLLFILASPALLRAQFQAPTDQELKMTADPKAPGAAAVYLNFEEIDNDALHLQSFYARIKVLEEKGKELATVELPAHSGDTRVGEIQARTIHSDGTIIPLSVKPEDLLISKSGEWQWKRKIFTLPSVEVGSILEYRYNLHNDENEVMAPRWVIQQPYYVHKANYAFTPFKAFLRGAANMSSHYVLDNHGERADTLIWWPILPAGAQVKTDALGRYSLEVTDIPPIPDEEWMPPVQNFCYKVSFDYINAKNADDFWSNEIKFWSKDVNRFADPAKPIQEAVSSLIVPGDSDLEKARKLYKAVQALDNTDFSRKKGESELKQLKMRAARRAEDIWAQKGGSSEDIALLYLAMVRAAGLSANAMKLVDREKGGFDRTYLYASQLNDTIVLLNIGGKEMALDPGEKMCPFQSVHWRHSSATGFLQGSDGKTVKTSPAQLYTDNKLARTGDLTLDAQGSVKATLRFAMTGQEALYWRQLALRNDDGEVKQQFDRWIGGMIPMGVEAHINRFVGMDDPDVNLVAMIEAHGSLGTATQRRVLLPGFFFETRTRQPFVDQDKRLEPVDMHYADIVSDQLVYHLPAGLALEGAPQDAKIAWPDHALLITKTVPSPGQIVVARKLARNFTFAKPEEYQDLRGFYQKVAAADQQQLVITVLPAGKGN